MPEGKKLNHQYSNNMTRFAGTFEIPVYAIGYLANDDPTGLSDLEIELIDGFMAATFPRGCSVDWDSCEQPHFSSTPEFGQPCEVYDAVMYGY